MITTSFSLPFAFFLFVDTFIELVPPFYLDSWFKFFYYCFGELIKESSLDYYCIEEYLFDFLADSIFNLEFSIFLELVVTCFYSSMRSRLACILFTFYPILVDKSSASSDSDRMKDFKIFVIRPLFGKSICM